MANEIKIEIWKNIKEYPNYKVSSLGKIKRIKTYVPGKNGSERTLPEMIKAVKPNKKGYLMAKLTNKHGNKNVSVHRIVATAFIKNSSNLPEINHKNCIKSDNRVDNLEWCTTKQNVHHAMKNGLRHPTLSNKQIIAIRSILSRNKNITQTDIANRYNVHQSTICKIANNQRRTIIFNE